jgi:Uri superfamily endonuclease
MRLADQTLDSRPGTYALLLELDEPTELEVGNLGCIRFDSPFYLYFGSAFGPGGLAARLGRHLQARRQAHWHIDYLRQVAAVVGAWHTRDTARLECTWAHAASSLSGARLVARFGSSDCRCRSHLVAVHRLPSLSAFRRRLDVLRPGCASIRQLRVPRPERAAREGPASTEEQSLPTGS